MLRMARRIWPHFASPFSLSLSDKRTKLKRVEQALLLELLQKSSRHIEATACTKLDKIISFKWWTDTEGIELDEDAEKVIAEKADSQEPALSHDISLPTHPVVGGAPHPGLPHSQLRSVRSCRPCIADARATGIIRATDIAVAASLVGGSPRDVPNRGVVEMAQGLSGELQLMDLLHRSSSVSSCSSGFYFPPTHKLRPSSLTGGFTP
jgi:hypothetical protein